MTSLQKRPTRTMPLRDVSTTSAVPVATLHANLMPPEVIARRRLGWLKRRLAFALVVLLVLLGLGYAFARQETAAADDDLAAEQDRGVGYSQQITAYDKVVRLQGDVAALRSRLSAVMGTDLAWGKLVTALTAAAPAGLVVNQVAGELADPVDSTTPDAGAYNPGGTKVVGTLSVSGTASGYRAVAAYVDALGRTKGFAQVDPGSVAAEAGRTTYTVTMSLTTAVLGGRYTPAGGK